jgi:hypothetical protein
MAEETQMHFAEVLLRADGGRPAAEGTSTLVFVPEVRSAGWTSGNRPIPAIFKDG